MLSALGLPALRGPSAAFREQKPICQCCIVPSTSGRRVELWRPVDQPPGHRSSVVAQAQRGRPKSKSPPKEKQPSTPSAPGQGKRGRPPKQGGAIAGGAAIAAGMGAASLRPGEEQDFFGPADDDVLAEDAQLLDVLAEGEDEEEDELGDDDDYDGLDDGFDMDDDEEEGEEYDLDDATARAGTSGPEGVPTEEIDYDTLVRQTQLPRGAPAQISIATAEELKRFNVGQDDGASKAVAIPEGAQLALNRSGYQAFEMDGIEFLVAETIDGKLDLRDSYVFDSANGAYMRPTVQGKLPSGPSIMQVIPWVERRSPDSLKRKEGMAKMKRVYFILVESLNPYRISMSQVFMFMGSDRVLSKVPVAVMGKDIQEPTLRIRADGVTIEDARSLPSATAIAEARDPDAGLSEEEKEARKREKMEELEAQAEELDELDEAPDVPAADMM